jgi:hypothetical protein
VPFTFTERFPFKHAIIDNFAPASLVRAADSEWPQDNWPHWYRYAGPDSVKLATKDCHRFPPACAELLRLMSCLDVEPAAGYPVFPDFLYHAGGLHCMPRGGHLQMHIDALSHPCNNWSRRLNAILFVHQEWESEWGGELVFRKSRSDKETQVSIEPKFNRLVLFEVTPESWHGVPAAIACPEGVFRKSLAAYWWSEGTDSTQTKASFSTS